ncbi:serine/threonine-protein kinase [Fimbriiglobus ruber]|uniref:Putative serine/threonine protein kinase n=1 Tax=Fimbriiglobus ruber TaxID=1908690 RepID=A0A225DDN3_9BACT|nr:serine/threonine-protein kinase [Fimbriiglobus ruber]OWK34515.1 putative serine/threonine protein kinase [Fimbriiglobus ruber]
MSINPAPARTETASQVWEVVGSQLDAFANAWQEGTPPDVARFLPAEPPAVRRLVLVELIKLDLDQRLQRGEPRPLEEYLREFPELVTDGIPSDLLYEDFHLRRQANLPVDPADYYRRFPDRAAELARLLGESVSTRSTAVTAARVPVDLTPGDQLDDFDLLAVLGQGQFAKVFLARQRAMQRLVALKVSCSRGVEAQTLAQLDHPHIVRVYDQRQVPDRGVHLVYMTYLPGGTLQALIDRVRHLSPDRRSGQSLLGAVDAALDGRGEVPPHASSVRREWTARSWPATVCALGVKLASALDYAHRHGVLHRDIKPANVLLTAEGEPLLADFNVGCCSKVEGAGPAAFFGGSLAYMAPEHLEAFNPDHPRSPDSLDGRADVYGLAVTLWELLTGARPFGPESLQGGWPKTLEAMTARRRAGLPSELVGEDKAPGWRGLLLRLRRRNAKNPAQDHDGDVPGLRAVLIRCLDPDPDRRPADAGEMSRELALCLRPATRALVRPARGGWIECVRRYPVVTLFAIGLVPNGLASLFNIYYNDKEIITPWGRQAVDVFNIIIAIINSIFFPLGLTFFWFALAPVARGVRRMRVGHTLPGADLAALRKRCLRLGRIGAGVCAGCWAVAGIVWPVVLRAVVGPPPQGIETYVHLLISLTICGLVAASYPYFLVTFLAAHVFYPGLLGPDGPTAADGTAIRRVEGELGVFRAMAAAVPLVAMVVLAVRQTSDQYAVAILGAAGLVGVGLAYLLEGRIRRDLAALAEIPTRDE